MDRGGCHQSISRRSTERVSLDECKQVRLRYGRTSGFVVIDDVVAEGKMVERTPVSGYDGLSVGNVLSYDVKAESGSNIQLHNTCSTERRTEHQL